MRSLRELRRFIRHKIQRWQRGLPLRGERWEVEDRARRVPPRPCINGKEIDGLEGDTGRSAR